MSWGILPGPWPEIIGSDRREAFVAAMDEKAYGGFGRFDGRVMIVSKERERAILIEWFDPASGGRIRNESWTFPQLDPTYGPAFRKDHPEEFSQ